MGKPDIATVYSRRDDVGVFFWLYRPSLRLYPRKDVQGLVVVRLANVTRMSASCCGYFNLHVRLRHCSAATHDALWRFSVCPSVVLFVRSLDGKSNFKRVGLLIHECTVLYAVRRQY